MVRASQTLACAASPAERVHHCAEADADDELTPEERRRKKVRRAKRGVRSELSVSGGDWTRHGYATSDLLRSEDVVDSLPRVDVRRVSLSDFVERFEKPRRPCVLTHATDGWPAAPGGCRAWSLASLRERFGSHKFKVGSDDDGYAVRLKMSHFHDYVLDKSEGAPVDDSPLYVFDGTYGDREGSRALLDDYQVPPYFQEDLFSGCGEGRRPPYRWVVFGPARSGSSLHIDPLATSAWNALLVGRKRWALLPPSVPRADCKPRIPGVTDGEGATWFKHVLPRTRAADWPHARPLEAIQAAGEVMFVPNGWWHAVLNLEHTVAVTQNYVSSANFDAAWRHTRVARPRLCQRWAAWLKDRRPDLSVRAEALDAAGLGDVSESSPSSSSSSSSSESEGSDGEPPSLCADAPPPASPSRKRIAPPLFAPVTAGDAGAAEQGASWRRRCPEEAMHAH